MGLTHYAILNNLLPYAKFTLVDPNPILNLIAKKNINGKFLIKDNNYLNSFDLTLITTPPFVHEKLLYNCIRRGDKRIFVEKPFGGYLNFKSDITNPNVYIGYVLRFNPINQWVKSNVNPNNIIECHSEYLSNTIDNKPKGWRNGSFSGVLNEMGSHMIDLNNYLFGISDYNIISKEIKSHISDVDDEVSFAIDSNKRKFNFYFNWVDKSVRKPKFSVHLKLKDDSKITFDQQNITITKNGELKNISVVELKQHLPFYLRGVDYTRQMQDLIGSQQTLCSIKEALIVNGLMKEILQ